MPLLLLKLTLTPLLVGGASLATRRWGPAIGGWIVSLPLTSGPVLFFLALGEGPAFAAQATVGTLLGLGAICGFCAAYLLASRRGPVVAMLAATGAYALVAIAVQPVAGAPFAIIVVAVVAALMGVLRLLPPPVARTSPRAHPRWDLPARVIVGTLLVVLFTTIAPLLGPVTSGIVTTFPVYVSVLSVFEHARAGRAAALEVQRGLLTGLVGPVAYYIVVRALVEPAGVAVAFSAAVVVTGIVGVIALRFVRAGTAGASASLADQELEPETV
ncbi:MAG: hypothetical protein WCK58_07285 [Chloroflexota bacterium]